MSSVFLIFEGEIKLSTVIQIKNEFELDENINVCIRILGPGEFFNENFIE
jgi:hypothetical protein